MSPPRFDALAFVALFLLFFMGFKILAPQGPQKALAAVDITVQTDSLGGSGPETAEQDNEPAAAPASVELSDEQPAADTPEEVDFIAPYEEYVITQGVHGYSYGHMAIDLAAGKGAKILSPINGKVKELYVDQYGNPTIVIENNRYRVTMLHGIYTVNPGEKVRQGQKIGKESNLGYTLDMYGNICTNRDCGYHTHLNVFDKSTNANVNPLDLIDS
jgi:murein DD-endopeptidase MepM/ murein hydrolase activator NlpD